MRYLILQFVSSILFFSCKQKSENQVKQFPVLLDSSEVAIRQEFITSTSIRNNWADYKMHYIGKQIDSIYLVKEIYNFNPPLPLPPSENIQQDNAKKLKTTNPFEKYVRFLELCQREKGVINSRFEITINPQIKHNIYYGTMVKNIEQDTVCIETDGELFMYFEAINTEGNWQRVQEQFARCGNGFSSVLLPPNECIITLAPIMHGNIKTKLRLRLGKNVSNEIDGYVYDKQFLPNYLQ